MANLNAKFEYIGTSSKMNGQDQTIANENVPAGTSPKYKVKVAHTSVSWTTLPFTERVLAVAGQFAFAFGIVFAQAEDPQPGRDSHQGQ